LGRNGGADSGRFFTKAFTEGRALPYYNPHSFRDTLVSNAAKKALPDPGRVQGLEPEISAHDNVITTLTSLRRRAKTSAGGDHSQTGGFPEEEDAEG